MSNQFHFTQASIGALPPAAPKKQDSYRDDTSRGLICLVTPRGIKSFYVPRSHPDGISVNLRCIDEGTVEGVDFSAFDGRNWEENISKLSPISD